jgi:hypothetical protein
MKAEKFLEGKGLPFALESKYQSLDISNSDGRFEIQTKKGFEVIYWGNWIIRRSKDDFIVVTDSVFNARYKTKCVIIEDSDG